MSAQVPPGLSLGLSAGIIDPPLWVAIFPLFHLIEQREIQRRGDEKGVQTWVLVHGVMCAQLGVPCLPPQQYFPFELIYPSQSIGGRVIE